MKQDDINLVNAYLDGTITDADFSRFQTLLRENAEARRMLRDLATVDSKLQELAALNPATLELLSAAVGPRKKPARKVVPGRRLRDMAPQGKSVGAFWSRPLVRWIATGAAAAVLLFAFFAAGNHRGQFNVLAAVAETQKTARLPRLRQYGVDIARTRQNVATTDAPPVLENGMLRSRGTERFVFTATRPGLLAKDMRVSAGRDERGYWGYFMPLPFCFRAQSWPKFDEALPDFNLRYMELGPIIAALNADFDIADRGLEPQDSTPGLRHLQGTLKPEHHGPIQLLDFWIDSESEIVRLEVLVPLPAKTGDTLKITFKRGATDFQGEDVFQPAHYAPPGTPDVDLESSPLRNLFNKLGRD